MATQFLNRAANGKYEGVAFPSAARALAQAYSSDVFITPYGKSLTVVIEVTTGAATPAVTPRIKSVTADGLQQYTVLVGAQITSTSAAVVVMRAGNGVAEVTNLGTGIPVPARWFVEMTHGDTDSLTYSVYFEVT